MSSTENGSVISTEVLKFSTEDSSVTSYVVYLSIIISYLLKIVVLPLLEIVLLPAMSYTEAFIS